MPGYKTHIVGGITWFFVAFLLMMPYLFPLDAWWRWLLFSIAGSLFPDIDTKSKGQHYYYWLVFIMYAWLLVYQYYACMLVLSVVALIPIMARHRGLFHKAWFLILFPCVVWLACAWCWPAHAKNYFFDCFFFILGALSHIWLDLRCVPLLRRIGMLKRP